MVIPTIVGLITVYDWISRSAPSVIVIVRRDFVSEYLPRSTEDVLILLEHMRRRTGQEAATPHYLTDLGQRIKREYKLGPESHEPRIIDRGTEPLREERADDPPFYPFTVYQLYLVNQGTKSAKDVRVSVSAPGYFEIFPLTAASEPIGGRTDKEIIVGSLEPRQQRNLTIWLDTDIPEAPRQFHVTFDGEPAVVVQEQVIDPILYYTIEIPKSIVPGTIISIVVVGAATFLWMSERRRRALQAARAINSRV